MKKKTLLGVAAAAAVGAAGWYLAAGGRKNQIEHIRREAKRLLAVRRDELAALRAMPNVILTDHTAFYTYEDVKSMVRGVLESAAAFAEGSPTRHDVTDR